MSKDQVVKSVRNKGFDGRIFLTRSEWQTYCRRKPVRYIRRKKCEICRVCGKPSEDKNPFESAHIIGFDIGIIDLALTPDFLDSEANIATAHRIACNKASELSLHSCMDYLKSIGIKTLPTFLPLPIRKLWNE